jgi:Leucine-rich repeat (LRR) protein
MPERIDSKEDGLAGDLPASIGDLGPQLEELILEGESFGNVITGSVPDEIGLLTGLTDLGLAYNQLTSLPATIGDLANLVDLDLHRNQITSVPASVGDLTNLMSLFLSYNSITTLPAEISQLNLVIFMIDNNQLTSVPETFRTFSTSSLCSMDGNSGFSCANIDSSGSCCTTQNCGDTSTCYTPP